jgi:hypothetical protein
MRDSNSCPYCGTQLPVSKIWRSAFRWDGIVLRRRTGLTCPECNHDVVIKQARAVVAGFSLLIGGAVALACVVQYFERARGIEFSKVGHALFLLGGIGALIWIHEFITPLFLQVRKPKPMEDVDMRQ